MNFCEITKSTENCNTMSYADSVSFFHVLLVKNIIEKGDKHVSSVFSVYSFCA